MAAPTSADLATFLGRPVTPEQGNAVLLAVTAMASAYTRGEGFTAGVPNEVIARGVIVPAAARLLAHPRQIGMNETLGPQSAGFREGFTGWSTAELGILNGLRKRAA